MRICEAPKGCGNVVWGTDKNTGKGYCNFHQYLRTDLSKKSIIQKAMEKAKLQKVPPADKSKIRSLIKTDENKLVINNASENINELENWFDDFAKIIEADPYCDECRSFIYKKFYRSASAHCLPKRKEYGFPSVATHPTNRLKLGNGCGCHHRYDSSWEAASKMKIWNQVVEIFKILYPFIAPEEHKNIPDILRVYIPQNK